MSRPILTILDDVERLADLQSRSGDAARLVLPAEMVALCTVPTLSSAKVKKLVPPAMYVACCTSGEPRIVVS